MSTTKTLVGAWGGPAIALLERSVQRDGQVLDRAGELAVKGATGADNGQWRAWTIGRLTNAPELSERLGAPPGEDLPALLARAHAQLGAGACEHLHGTFLVAATDGERALVIRDQLGGRPLLYARVGSGLLFAEQARDILDLLPGTPTPDRMALMQWIDRGTLPPGRTLHDGLRRVPPAHRLVLSRRAVEVERYWLPRYEGLLTDSRETLAERLRVEAFAAVERAAVGSRRPALRLSGGLDSACLAAGLAASKGPASDALAFGAVFPEQPETDERELIEATARHTGLALELVACAEHVSALSPALEHIARWRVPPASPNLFVWEPVMAITRGLGVDMMLDGEGGDELFGLAPRLIADQLRRGRFAAAWSLTGRIPGMGAHPDARTRLRALRRFGVGPLIPNHVRRRRRAGLHLPGSLLKPADTLALVELETQATEPELDGPFWWRDLADDLINGNEAFDASAHLQRETIDGGVERRHPFMYDIELVRTVLTIPPALQFDPLRDRALLRDALAGRIPEEVRTRYSKSFFTPLLHNALHTEGEALTRRLACAEAPIRAYVSGAALDRLLAAVAAGGETRRTRQLWQACMADTWLRAAEHPEYLRELSDDLAGPRGA
jgi:asparagine synthase (glutamine-hydrolysing)